MDENNTNLGCSASAHFACTNPPSGVKPEGWNKLHGWVCVDCAQSFGGRFSEEVQDTDKGFWYDKKTPKGTSVPNENGAVENEEAGNGSSGAVTAGDNVIDWQQVYKDDAFPVYTVPQIKAGMKEYGIDKPKSKKKQQLIEEFKEVLNLYNGDD